MHCPGHFTVQGSQLASVGRHSGQNESRVKNDVPYLEGQFDGGGRLEIAANNKFEMFLHNLGPILFFNICGWAFVRGSIFLEICLKNPHF